MVRKKVLLCVSLLGVLLLLASLLRDVMCTDSVRNGIQVLVMEERLLDLRTCLLQYGDEHGSLPRFPEGGVDIHRLECPPESTQKALPADWIEEPDWAYVVNPRLKVRDLYALNSTKIAIVQRPNLRCHEDLVIMCAADRDLLRRRVTIHEYQEWLADFCDISSAETLPGVPWYE